MEPDPEPELPELRIVAAFGRKEKCFASVFLGEEKKTCVEESASQVSQDTGRLEI